MQRSGFIFSGQGAQIVGMASCLYEHNALVRSFFDRANDVLNEDLKRICFEGPEATLTETRYCQPALYVMGYAVAAAIKEAQPTESPIVAFGLSLGELTACAMAGVFSFEQGLQIVSKRGALMQEACESTQGSMACIIGQEEATIQSLCDEFEIDLGNLNCTGQIVISGASKNVAEAVNKAKSLNFKRVIPLNVAGAYHSRLMQPAQKAFADYLDTIEFQKPERQLLTNVTGDLIEEPDAIRSALIKQITSTVRMEDCLKRAATLEIDTFYECGPGRVLAGLAKRTDKSLKVISVATQDELIALNA